jgi:hypothetical protein
MKRSLLAGFLLAALGAAHAVTQTTAFTYQGSLTANGAPANGSFDLTFKLFDAATGGNEVGSPVVMLGFPVVNGRFTTDVDFPNAFAGDQRWLEVTVGTQVLSPRQAVNSVPVAQGALTCCSPNTVVVSGGADTHQNGSNLIAALNRIAALTPSASNTFLLKLEPGSFDLGTTPLQLVPFVQLEGSGEGITQITGAGQAVINSGVILAANNTELRKLTVQSQTGNAYSTGIYADNTITTTFSINHVTVQALDGTSNGTGIYNNGGSPSIENVTIGVFNSTANGLGYGISNSNNAAQIKNSAIQVHSSGTGQANGIYNNNGAAATLINNVTINVSTSGVPMTSLSPDAIGIASTTSSPLIEGANITASSTGGGSSVGVALNNTSAVLTNTTIENSRIVVNASGASFTQGILNNTSINNPAGLVVRSSSITVVAGNKANCQVFGINSFGGPTAFYNTTINTSVGTGCLAAVGLILQGGPNDLTFNNGSVTATQYAIYNSNGTAKVKVGASQLSAPTTVSGAAVCINSFKSDYTATTATCG